MTSREWEVAYSFTKGKNPDQTLSEDTFITDNRFAVIDGATDKSGLKYTLEGEIVSAGKFASHAVASALGNIPSGTPIEWIVKEISEKLNEEILSQYPDIADENRPTASIAVFEPYLKKVWMVGDCLIGFIYKDNGVIEFSNGLAIDMFLGAIRKAVIVDRERQGNPWRPDLGESDPGREAIMPILKMQGLFANSSEPFGYGVINGKEVQTSKIVTYHVGDNCSEIVLASDGYPHLIVNNGINFGESERELKRFLEEDPLCIDLLRGNKGLVRGNLSHDDRTWLQLKIKA